MLSAARQLHSTLASLSPITESSLSNPSVVTALPFLWLDHDVPERMSMSDLHGVRHFSFMGRTRMADLLHTIRGLTKHIAYWRKVCSPHDVTAVAAPVAAAAAASSSSSSSSSSAVCGPFEASYLKLLVYGTPGWGKSYMMAAAAVVLRQDFLCKSSSEARVRVIYLPDCGQLRAEPVDYMKKALLLAFAEDEQRMQQIVACMSIDSLVSFIRSVPRTNSFLLFVADQTNKLMGKQTDSAAKQASKMAAHRLLERASFSHFLVEAISINDSNKDDVAQKQENRKEMPVFGEMSEVSANSCRDPVAEIVTVLRCT